MIIVISNRAINEGTTDDSLFGEGPNAKGLDEVRLAMADYNESNKEWTLDLLPEPDTLTAENLPSRKLFKDVLKGIKEQRYKSDWVFYVHGFDQSFRQTLDASHQIAQRYAVDVIVVSWVANPGGFVKSEYNRARQAAKASANAIDHAIEKIGNYLKERTRSEIEACEVRLNLLVHSLGNYLLEQFVRNPIF